MLKCLRYLLAVVVVLGLFWIDINFEVVEGGNGIEIEGVELERKNPITGEEELFNTEDGQYHKIVDMTEITKKEADKEIRSGKVKYPKRNRPESFQEIPDPVQAGHGTWYYTSDITDNPAPNPPRNGIILMQ